MYSEIIPIFSPLWCKYTIVFSISFIVLLLLAKTSYKELIANALGFFLFFDLIFVQLIKHSSGMWTFDTALPLQFCSVMSVAAGVALITRWRWTFELILFLGMVAPFQAILSPGFAFSHRAFVLSYYMSHGVTIVAPLFLIAGFGMKPRVHSWWKVPLTFAFFLIPVSLVNYFGKANYMFLMRPPELKNPLILGEWPYYVIVWVFMLLAASCVIYYLCRGLQDSKSGSPQ